MTECGLDGVFLEEVKAAKGCVKVVGGSDSWIKVFIVFPLVHPGDESLVVTVELDGGNVDEVERISLIMMCSREHAEKAKNIPVAYAWKEFISERSPGVMPWPLMMGVPSGSARISAKVALCLWPPSETRIQVGSERRCWQWDGVSVGRVVMESKMRWWSLS